MDQDETRVSVEEESAVSTVADDIEAMLSGLEPVVTQKSLLGELPTALPNVVHHVQAQGLKVPTDVSEGENYGNAELEEVKEERNPSLEELNAYKMKKEDLK